MTWFFPSWLSPAEVNEAKRREWQDRRIRRRHRDRNAPPPSEEEAQPPTCPCCGQPLPEEPSE
jgi:hypothetical protein